MIVPNLQKEIALLLRDRGRLLSLFLLPVVFIVVFGSMFKFGPSKDTPQPIAFYCVDGDGRGEKIRETLDHTPGFISARFSSPDQVRRAVANEEVNAGLIVPTDPAQLVELVIDLGQPAQVRA